VRSKIARTEAAAHRARRYLSAMLLALLAACGPLRSQSGYSDAFTVPPRIDVGTATPTGIEWASTDTSGRFEGVIVASWCPTSKDLLAARAADPALAAATPDLYFLAEEADLHLASLVEQGRMTPEQAAETDGGLDAAGALVLDPKAFASITPKALHWADVPAKWFPYFFTCDDGTCRGWSGHW